MLTDTPDDRNLRQDHRSLFTSVTGVRVRQMEDEPVEQQGTAVDLSQGGVKFRLPAAIPPKSPIEFSIDGLDETRSAIVCWSRPAPGGAWWVGCRFAEPLPVGVIDELAVQGVIDRRLDDRRLMSTVCFVRFPLSQEECPAKVVNLSEGGFSLITARDPEAAGQLMLILRQPKREITVPAKIAWCKRVDDGYQLGCQLVSSAGEKQLKRAFTRRHRSFLADWRARQDSRRTVALTVTLVMVWSLWLLLSDA